MKNKHWRGFSGICHLAGLLEVIPSVCCGMVFAFVASATIAAETAEPIKCEKTLLSAFVIEDQITAPAWTAEQLRLFRLPIPAVAVRQVLEASGCLQILDSDPVFAGIAATVQPDAVLRIRLAAIKAGEKTLGEKAGSAVGRYLGSYFGDSGEIVPALTSVELAADLLCARTRRAIQQFKASASGTENVKSENNSATFSEACTQLSMEVIRFLQTRPDACEPARQRRDD